MSYYDWMTVGLFGLLALFAVGVVIEQRAEAKVKRRHAWYLSVARLGDDQQWAVEHCADFPGYVCVVVRSTRYLSIVFPVKKVDLKGWTQYKTYLIGFLEDDNQIAPDLPVQLSDLQKQIDR